MAGVADGRDLHPPRSSVRCDVLVVGGGPSGAAAAYWLAESGVDVVVVERKHFPREKTCGDGLTPRAVRQLGDMGLADALAGHHRYDGLRSIAFGREMRLPWPDHRDFPAHGYVITRADLDALAIRNAEKAGAVIWEGAEALSPISDGPDGALSGAVIADRDHKTSAQVTANYVVVADGANSRIGRALGSSRVRSYPMGMAIRGYYTSPRHDEPWIESHLDVRDGDGDVVPGYGWIFPLGDGRVNVGAGLLTTAGRWRHINTTRLFEAFVAAAPPSWCLSPQTSCGPPTGGRLPMGLSVGPRAGTNHLLVGDAGGSINPFNGEGIGYAYETGRLAADVLLDARSGAGTLMAYPARLDETYGLYYKVARLFVAALGRPRLMRALVGVGMQSETLMAWILRIMANLLRPGELGPAEAAYRAAAALARRIDG